MVSAQRCRCFCLGWGGGKPSTGELKERHSLALGSRQRGLPLLQTRPRLPIPSSNPKGSSRAPAQPSSFCCLTYARQIRSKKTSPGGWNV